MGVPVRRCGGLPDAGKSPDDILQHERRGYGAATRQRPVSDAPAVLWLDDEQAENPALTGAKGAALASAARAGLPVIPGFVIATAATDGKDAQSLQLPADVKAAWSELAHDGADQLVVRSSSLAEDLGDTSMAGRFESVVGVSGWDAFVDAVGTVLDSRLALSEAGEDAGDAPLGVLVQRLVNADAGGVMFSADPVSGDPDVVVVSAVAGGPDALVSGEANGSTYRLDAGGDVIAVEKAEDGADLTSGQAVQLAEMVRRCADHFGDPQDVEWAFDRDGALWLLQSRPMTTAVGRPTGPLLGPGPVSETFPDPLYPLESDLWVPPLRSAVREALLLSGAAQRRVDRSPLVVSLGGRVAVDLELFNAAPETPTPWYSRLDPRPRIRRLRAAWRVGRLKSALPGLAEDLVVQTDAALARVPVLDDLTPRQLIELLHRGQEALVALHGHEILVGLLTIGDRPHLTGTAIGLRVLAMAREEGLSDAEAVAAHPSVLALTPPHIAVDHDLPPTDLLLGPLDEAAGEEVVMLREALRLRVRWVQELQARAASVLGDVLAADGALSNARLVRRLRLAELEAAVYGRAVPWEVHEHRRDPDSRPLPSAFRMSDHGEVLPDQSGATGGGEGAGGGRGTGVVHRHDDSSDPPTGCVLVVRTLSPDLAPHLPKIDGLVAETGSVLAHTAILAREQGVPTVVGRHGAYDEFVDGDSVTVDGSTGRVEKVEDDS